MAKEPTFKYVHLAKKEVELTPLEFHNMLRNRFIHDYSSKFGVNVGDMVRVHPKEADGKEFIAIVTCIDGVSGDIDVAMIGDDGEDIHDRLYEAEELAGIVLDAP